MMHSPVDHPLRLFVRRRRRLLFNLFVIVATVMTLFPKVEPAYAQVPAAPSVGQATVAQALDDIDPCDLIPIPYDAICETPYPPPELLYLKQRGIFTTTTSQLASLRNLENQAVETVLALHGLPPADANAVRTWGRDDVLAQLYLLMVDAIDTTATARTTDQQNTVDWITTVAKRRNVAAARNAAREYVKWAGLGRGNFDVLMSSNPTKDQIQAFLSGTVVNYDLPPPDATEGWCAYRSPAPYGGEYQGYNNPICVGPFIGLVLPPTPTYDEFVKWGSAKANYLLLSSGGYLSRAQSLSVAMGIAIPLGAVIGGYTTYAAAASVVANTTRLAAVMTSVGRVYQAATLSAAIGSLAVAGVALVTTLIAAIATAIIVGINVTNAANLPGKLATLVDTANSTTPDAATLVGSTDSTNSLLSLFIAVTTPAPSLNICDNSIFLAPGMYELTLINSDQVRLTDSTPCLNPTSIPAAVTADPQFIVTAKNTGAQTLSPTISVKDAASSTVTTARLNKTWFVTQSNGSTAQTLRISYTDWNSKQQNAWLIGNATDGYAFLTFAPPADASTTVDASICVADGSCGVGASIKYIGADDQQYSATVRPYQAPTGTPTVTSAVEGSPATLDANGFAPGGAVAPITYQWSFKASNCSPLSCATVATASGTTATYTWQTGSTYQVDLTATDALGAQATTTLQVPVISLPPTLTFAPDCATSPGVPCNTWSGAVGSSVAIRGTVGYAGSRDFLRVRVSWGDGSQDAVDVDPSGFRFPGGSPLTFTPVASQLAYTMLAPHIYANPGVYQGSVSITNVLGLSGDGGTINSPFTVVVIGTQTITFPNSGSRSYGDVFSIAATGGASGQPVTFAANSSCALSNISGGPGTGSATVTVLSAGFCDITASQAGAAAYTPAPEVRQRVFTLLAPLTVTAPSPTITYGEAAPALAPGYSGFRLSDTASTLTTPAACVVAPNSGATGAYATSCAGAAAPNYSVDYVPGTLTINPAPLTITANDKTMTHGAAVPRFDAQASGLVNGDTSSVLSGLRCGARDANGQAVGSGTPAGSYPITCSGGSAANYSLSYVGGTLTITKAETTTALSAAPNATVYGQPATFTAAVSVSGPGAGQPGGTVAFYDSGSTIAGCAAQPVNPATRTATCTTAALGIAQHSITAIYSGDANVVGSSAATPLTQTVNKAAVATTLGASANPSAAGQAVTFSATVAAAAPGAGTPSGTVTFRNGATIIGTGRLSTSNGATVGTFTTSGLTVGQHTISASFGGDGNFLAGSVVMLTQYVNTNLSSYPRLANGAYNLSNRNLAGGYFVDATLARASLNNSNLTGAVFLRANLAGANLRNSNLKEANLAGANLTGANLTGANLKDASGLGTATLTNVIWSNTTCPDGTISNANGGTCVGHLK